MMQPISCTAKASKSGEGGFNYTAVSMTTSYIKRTAQGLSTHLLGLLLPLEQSGQVKSPAAFQHGLHRAGSLMPSPHNPSKGPKEPASYSHCTC